MPTCLNEKDWKGVLEAKESFAKIYKNVKIGIDCIINFDKKLYIFKNDKG